jgi:DNA recombination protein RmuC
MNTTTILLVIAIFLLLILIGAIVFLALKFTKRENDDDKPKDDTGLKLILEQVNELNRTVDQKLRESSRTMNDAMYKQFSESQRLVRDVTQSLTKLDETNKQVIGFADQLKSLQDVLKNPKQRGVLGEYYLETILKNVLPPGSYQMQYNLGKTDDGKDLIVDSAVFVKDKVIPIDSKFSLENYNRIVETSDLAEKERLEKLFVNDLKLRITETSKYIRPQNGTMDFAFMFIPHEAIYYDLLVNKIGAIATEDTENLIQRAASKYKVIIVSPTSFLAYLQTVLQGLKAMKIEEQAKDIVKRVGELGTHLKKYEEYHNKLGNALGTVVNHYNSSGKELKKVDKDVFRITDVEAGIDVLAIEKPEENE